MNKLIIIVVLAILVVGGFFLLQQKIPVEDGNTQNMSIGQNAKKALNINAANATPEDVSIIHETMDPSNLNLLKQIIKTNPDSYTRERAIMTFGDISLRTNRTGEALVFPKEFALNEINSEIKSTAYANYYYLKDKLATKPSASLEVSAVGPQTVGSNLSIVFSAKNSKPSNAKFIIKKIEPTGNKEDHLAYENEPYTQTVVGKLELLSKNSEKFDLNAGETKEVVYVLALNSQEISQ